MTTREIPLTRGFVSLINEAHWSLVEPFKWCARPSKGGLVYAQTNIRRPDGKQTTMQMHRLIVGASVGEIVDHINHNGCDNRYPENLRLCTNSQNSRNQRVRRNNMSGYKGVSRHNATGRWAAIAGGVHLGVYDSEQEAAQAYNAYVVSTWGAFALPNQGVPSLPIAHPLNKRNTSGYRGVTWNKRLGKWIAQIGVGGRGGTKKHLGCFTDSWDAAQTWNMAARAAFGDAAYQNVCHPEPAEQVSA